MVDCLGNYNVWYDAQSVLLAVLLVARHLPRIAHVRVQTGDRAALTDIQNNHPNDYVSLMMFSVAAIFVDRH